MSQNNEHLFDNVYWNEKTDELLVGNDSFLIELPPRSMYMWKHVYVQNPGIIIPLGYLSQIYSLNQGEFKHRQNCSSIPKKIKETINACFDEGWEVFSSVKYRGSYLGDLLEINVELNAGMYDINSGDFDGGYPIKVDEQNLLSYCYLNRQKPIHLNEVCKYLLSDYERLGFYVKNIENYVIAELRFNLKEKISSLNEKIGGSLVVENEMLMLDFKEIY